MKHIIGLGHRMAAEYEKIKQKRKINMDIIIALSLLLIIIAIVFFILDFSFIYLITSAAYLKNYENITILMVGILLLSIYVIDRYRINQLKNKMRIKINS